MLSLVARLVQSAGRVRARLIRSSSEEGQGVVRHPSLGQSLKVFFNFFLYTELASWLQPTRVSICHPWLHLLRLADGYPRGDLDHDQSSTTHEAGIDLSSSDWTECLHQAWQQGQHNWNLKSMAPVPRQDQQRMHPHVLSESWYMVFLAGLHAASVWHSPAG